MCPLSLALAFLWYEPMHDGSHRVLIFGLVTAFDLLSFLAFLFEKIFHLRSRLTSDIEKGHLEVAEINDASARIVSGENEQVQHRNAGARPEITPSENDRLQVMRDIGYDIDAVNRSRKHIGSNPVRVNPRSVVAASDGPAAARPPDGMLRRGRGMAHKTCACQIIICLSRQIRQSRI